LPAACAGVLLAVCSLAAPAAAVTVTASGVWGTPGNNGKGLALGSDQTETCFLSGVSGSLNGNPTQSAPYRTSVQAIAQVMDEGGTWVLRTHAGTGTGVKAYATCISATANRAVYSFEDNISSEGVPVTPNRHCFLAKVWITVGMTGKSGFGLNLQTNLTISKENGAFGFGNSFVNTSGGSMDYGGAVARCVDIPPGSDWSFTHTGPVNGINSATDTIALHSSPGGPLVPIAGVACFLTAISGKWIADPDPLGWADGVFLTADAKTYKSWRLTASNGRGGSVECVR
jgi:hypothetical protein